MTDRGGHTASSAVRDVLGAVVIVSFVVALVACQAFGLQSTGNGGTGGTTGSPSAATTPGPASTSAAQPATPTPVHEAAATVKAYLDALINGRYAAAWQLVAHASQALWGTEAQFEAERGAFYGSAGPAVEISDPENAAQTLAAWIPNTFDGDRSRAYVVKVNHPRIPSNASREVLIAAPDSSGEWRIWIGR